jgi:hypothetical protein
MTPQNQNQNPKSLTDSQNGTTSTLAKPQTPQIGETSTTGAPLALLILASVSALMAML